MTVDPATALRSLLDGFRVSQAIHVAAVLGVADAMDGTPTPSSELAARVGAHPKALYRLLRTLASVGVFHEHDDECFSLTPLGECLRSDAATPLGPYAAFIGQENQWHAWGALLHGVKTGQSPFATVHGMDVWTYREQHPEQNAIFNRAMSGNSSQLDRAVARALDVGGRRVADIGGGEGALLTAILQEYPSCRGVLFDRPHVTAGAERRFAQAGVAERAEVRGGDMFEALPADADVYLMKHVLHDWQDPEVLAALEVCHRSMPPQAELIVVERLLGPPNQDALSKLIDLHMLVVPGGIERSADEFRELFARAGFRLTRRHEVSHLSLLWCTKA